MFAQAAHRVCVVIPALNEVSTIGVVLDSLAAQNLPPDEVIVVDAGSRDDTRKVAEKSAARFEVFRVLESPGAFPGKARNVGAAASNAEWLIFLDCGTRVQPNSVEALFREATARGADVVFGRSVAETTSLFTECAAVSYLPPIERDGILLPQPTVQLLLIRRRVFEASRGFAEHLRSAEDLLFFERLEQLGVRVGFSPDALFQWQLAPDLASTFRRFRTYSQHNLRAGLYKEWQLHLGFYHVAVVLASVFIASVFSRLPFALLPYAIFYALRAAKSLWKHRLDLSAGAGRQVVRFVLVGLILGIIDLATFVGTWDYLYRKHFSKGSRTTTVLQSLRMRNPRQ